MILIIDDDNAIRASLSLLLRRAHYEVETVDSPETAMEAVRRTSYSLIMMDMNFRLSTTGEEGIELLQKVKIFQPEVPVILMTAWGSIELAVRGMKAGAFDFVTKPWNNLVLLHTIETAIRLHEQSFEKVTDSHFEKIIGKSKAIKDILSTVAHIAPTDASVLITGESGTGKELIAEAIHANSRRNSRPFVKVNLGGLSQSLFESEMFGHKKGAFTDATCDRTGRFELADQGTIFLDEIGDLDISCQVKLLRVLQDQTYEMLGDSHPRKVDVRVVSATNRSLTEMVADKTFREDLFFRINLISIHLPALRERAEDIPLLIRHFAKETAAKNQLQEVNFSSAAMDYMQSLPYPGNIRELKNLVERLLLISAKETIEMEDIKKAYATAEIRQTPTGGTLIQNEKQLIIDALKKCHNNLSQTAISLGISRAALYRRLEKYGLNEEQN